MYVAVLNALERVGETCCSKYSDGKIKQQQQKHG